mmetsp:Transcript_14997/g.48937  ORF Transcript_14997/g.48937 Transcript_14997/m.48937 type:complete len:390 (+) Transcript_14997:554-1723(+)
MMTCDVEDGLPEAEGDVEAEDGAEASTCGGRRGDSRSALGSIVGILSWRGASDHRRQLQSAINAKTTPNASTATATSGTVCGSVSGGASTPFRARAQMSICAGAPPSSDGSIALSSSPLATGLSGCRSYWPSWLLPSEEEEKSGGGHEPPPSCCAASWLPSSGGGSAAGAPKPPPPRPTSSSKGVSAAGAPPPPKSKPPPPSPAPPPASQVVAALTSRSRLTHAPSRQPQRARERGDLPPRRRRPPPPPDQSSSWRSLPKSTNSSVSSALCFHGARRPAPGLRTFTQSSQFVIVAHPLSHKSPQYPFSHSHRMSVPAEWHDPWPLQWLTSHQISSGRGGASSSVVVVFCVGSVSLGSNGAAALSKPSVLGTPGSPTPSSAAVSKPLVFR